MAAKIHIYLCKAKLKEVSLVLLNLREKKIFNGNLIVYFHNVPVALAEKFWKFHRCLPPLNCFALCG